MQFIYGPDFWVAVAFLIFLGLLWKMGAFRAIGSGLDSRAAAIGSELEQARALREEAEKVLAEYKRRQQEAEAEARAILDAAKREAAELSAEAGKRMEEFVARRTKLAETKIAQAEIQALADVRAAAADTAVKAAERLLAETVKGKTQDDLIASAIKDVKARIG